MKTQKISKNVPEFGEVCPQISHKLGVIDVGLLVGEDVDEEASVGANLGRHRHQRVAKHVGQLGAVEDTCKVV